MIAAAVLISVMIFLFAFLLGKKILAGSFNQKKTIQERIFETSPSSSASGIFSGNLNRHQHYSDIASLQGIFEKQDFAKKLAFLFNRSGYKISFSVFFLLYLSIGSVVFLVVQFYLPPLPAAALGLLCVYFPFYQLRKKNRQYIEKFSEHLPDATSIISNALKTGQSIERAMENVGRAAPYPVAGEFQILTGEIKLGLPLEAALKNLYQRIQTDELKVFITGISIQQELGGNLSEIMENLEKTIRERYALHREIKVLSAQGVMSMWVLFCLPFAFAGVWAFSDKALLFEYINSPFGGRMIAFSAALQFVAFVWMKKAIKIE